MKRRLACLAAILLLALGAASAQAATCANAQRADEAVDHIDSWAALARWRASYLACDDGGIAEGVSEAVARLLVDQRPTLLAPPRVLVRPDLQKFVLRHVNATLATSDLEAIARLQDADCAASLAGLCGKIRAAAAAALREQSQVAGLDQASRTGATGARATNPVLSVAENPQAR